MAVKEEEAKSLLIIGNEKQKLCFLAGCTIDFIHVNEVYRINRSYDLIFSYELLEEYLPEVFLPIISYLLTKTTRQLMLIASKYSPLTYCSFDYTYIKYKEQDSEQIIYSFFPKSDYHNQHIIPRQVDVKPQNKLRLAFVLPDQELTGGMKQLLDLMREMHRRNYEVYAYLQANTDNLLPEWSNITNDDIDGQIVVPMDEDFLANIQPVDFIILGWMEQITQFMNAPVPVLLWEQGSSLLFGDYGKPIFSKSKELIKIRELYQSSIHITSVSPLIQKILSARFGRDSMLLPAGIDPTLYTPKVHVHDKKRVLLVGNPQSEFKNFKFALKAISMAKDNGCDFIVTWACQNANVSVDTCGVEVTYHIMPSQQQLAYLYQSSDLFLSTSLYEAFSLPPLESMASKTAVLAVDCGGITTYGVSDINCVLCEQNDFQSFSDAICSLLRDDKKRMAIADEGYKTSLQYTILSTADALEGNLEQIANG